MVAQNQAGDLDRVLQRNILQQLGQDPTGSGLEAAKALSVTRYIHGGLVPHRKRRGTPNLSGRFIADINRFAGSITHWIVEPWCELILVAIERPGVARAGFRNKESEGRVG